MIDDDAQPEEIEASTFPVPLCDEEDGPATRAHEPAQPDPSDEDVEGHGGWDFDRSE